MVLRKYAVISFAALTLACAGCGTDDTRHSSAATTAGNSRTARVDTTSSVFTIPGKPITVAQSVTAGRRLLDQCATQKLAIERRICAHSLFLVLQSYALSPAAGGAAALREHPQLLQLLRRAASLATPAGQNPAKSLPVNARLANVLF